jgi:hypothetical protein
MYIPGRLRTASSPSRTDKSDALYAPADFAADFLAGADFFAALVFFTAMVF